MLTVIKTPLFERPWRAQWQTNEAHVHLVSVRSLGKGKVHFLADDIEALNKFHPDISINYNHIAQILVLSCY